MKQCNLSSVAWATTLESHWQEICLDYNSIVVIYDYKLIITLATDDMIYYFTLLCKVWYEIAAPKTPAV